MRRLGNYYVGCFRWIRFHSMIRVEADGECMQEHGNSSSYVNVFISPGGRDPYCIGFVGP